MPLDNDLAAKYLNKVTGQGYSNFYVSWVGFSLIPIVARDVPQLFSIPLPRGIRTSSGIGNQT